MATPKLRMTAPNASPTAPRAIPAPRVANKPTQIPQPKRTVAPGGQPAAIGTRMAPPVVTKPANLGVQGAPDARMAPAPSPVMPPVAFPTGADPLLRPGYADIGSYDAQMAERNKQQALIRALRGF